MKNLKKLLLLVVVLAFVFALVGCGDDKKNESDPTKAPEATKAPEGNKDPEATPTPVDDRNLGGKEIVIADWWSDPEGNNERDTSTQYMEDYWDYQDKMMKDHNYTIVRKGPYGWGEVQSNAMLSITNGEPYGDIIVLDSGWVASLLDKGLFADVSALEEFNFSDDKWNQGVRDVMTVGNATYGFAASTEPRTGIFFNMDLFETLGIDKNLPYDLQAEGKWNWEEFEKLCNDILAKGDTDGNGVQDVYPLTGQNTVFYTALMTANNTNVIVKDKDGKLVSNLDDPAVLEALNKGWDWAEQTLFMPAPQPTTEGESIPWDWFKQAFQEQQAAMRIEEEYAIGQMQDYGFKVGFVCVPCGPNSDGMVSIIRENVQIIPSCFDKQHISDIAYAYNVFTSDVPGYEDDDASWKSGYEALFMDSRAVNETLDLMINKLPQVMRTTMLLPEYNDEWIWSIDSGEVSPAEQMEAYGSQWQTMCDDFNAKH